MNDRKYQAARNEAAKALGRLMATPQGRAYFKQNDWSTGQALVTAHYDEAISDVLLRVRRCPPPVTIAVAKDDGELLMMSFGPETDAPGDMNDIVNAHGASTIGMLYDAFAVNGPGSKGTFHLSDWDRNTRAVSMPSVKDLISAA